MTTARALLVTPDGSLRHLDVDTSLSSLQAIVDGPIEYVFVTYGVHAYCNEEGKLRDNLPPNPTATLLAGRLGVDMLMGSVIFLGDGPDGEEGDLPQEWLDILPRP